MRLSSRTSLVWHLQRPRRGWLAFALAAAACGAPGRPSTAPPRAADSEASAASASLDWPAWYRAPLSWDKLEDIEHWLGTPAAGADPLLALEGRLELAEGRLALAGEERAKLAPDVLKRRLDAAREGFADVSVSPAANLLQRERARRGLEGVKSLEASGQGLAVAGIVPRSSWAAAAPIPARMNKHAGPWTRITVHHSADSMGELAAGSVADGNRAVREIQRYHMQDPSLRWGDIGYHFVIDPLGRIYEGRTLTWQGAHAGGDNNRANIGICVLGSYVSKGPPPAALAALDRLVGALRTTHAIPRTQIYAHREFKKTVCPGSDLLAWVKSYRKSSDKSASMSILGAQPRAASLELSPTSSATSPGRAKAGSISGAKPKVE